MSTVKPNTAAKTVTIKGNSVPVVGPAPLVSEKGEVDIVALAVSSAPFQEWIAAVEARGTGMSVKAITVQGVDMFGPRVGFCKFKADVEVDGLFVPGIVFMRGGAVAILVILVDEEDGAEYALLTRQPRVPIGWDSFPEIVAGMLDGSGHFAGAAAREMQEETGITIDENELLDLTGLAYGTPLSSVTTSSSSPPHLTSASGPDAGNQAQHQAGFPGIFPSPGGCDEFIRLFAYRKKMSKAELLALQGKATGLREEGELIKLQVVPLGLLWKTTSDAKTLSALLLYQNLLAEDAISSEF